MKKFLIAFAAAGALLAATFATPNSAEARCRWNCAVGIGLGAAIVGGVVAGALAPRYQPYAVQQGYEPYQAYYASGPVDCPGGYWARKPRFDQWGNVMGYSKPRYFCPAY